MNTIRSFNTNYVDVVIPAAIAYNVSQTWLVYWQNILLKCYGRKRNLISTKFVKKIISATNLYYSQTSLQLFQAHFLPNFLRI